MSPPAVVAFSEATDGDMRSDPLARQGLSDRLGIDGSWATVSQVHGNAVIETGRSGPAGEADALFTTTPELPLAVFTADCVGVVVVGRGAVGVAHAGWRGAAAGVVAALADQFRRSGSEPLHASIGPHIRGCCFEVGEDVAVEFPGHVGTTTWGARSVDLASVVRSQLDGIPTADLSRCTRCGPYAYSHRRDGESRRMAAVAVLSR